LIWSCSWLAAARLAPWGRVPFIPFMPGELLSFDLFNQIQQLIPFFSSFNPLTVLFRSAGFISSLDSA
jgi:hypothetical protein